MATYPDSGNAQLPMLSIMRKCAWCTHTPLEGTADPAIFTCAKCGNSSDLGNTNGLPPTKVEA